MAEDPEQTAEEVEEERGGVPEDSLTQVYCRLTKPKVSTANFIVKDGLKVGHVELAKLLDSAEGVTGTVRADIEDTSRMFGFVKFSSEAYEYELAVSIVKQDSEETLKKVLDEIDQIHRNTLDSTADLAEFDAGAHWKSVLAQHTAEVSVVSRTEEEIKPTE